MHMDLAMAARFELVSSSGIGSAVSDDDNDVISKSARWLCINT